MDTKLFISIVISLSLIIVVVLGYIIYMSFKIMTIKKQIKVHKNLRIYNIALLLLISNMSKGVISATLLIVMLIEVGYAIYLNELFNKLTKDLIKMMEEDKNAKLESRRNL